MKKIVIIILAFILCTINVNAKIFNKIKISKIKYETHDARGNVQTGTLKFTTTYIYDIEKI